MARSGKGQCKKLKADIKSAKTKSNRGKALARYVQACKPRRRRRR